MLSIRTAARFSGNCETRKGVRSSLRDYERWHLARISIANGKPNEFFFTAGPTFPPNTQEYSNGLFGGIRAADDDDDSNGPSDD
jgi:hypothetical protein